MQAKLHIEGPYETRTVDVDGELSVGRTDLANLVLEDHGLSRVNTTFFIDDGELFVADEKSTNGTFVNGTKVERPVMLRDGDKVKIGSSTTIRVDLGGGSAAYSTPEPDLETQSRNQPSIESPPVSTTYSPPTAPAAAASNRPPMILIAAALMTLAILLFAGVAYIVVSQIEPKPPGGGVSNTPTINTAAVIPVRVIDPLGGEDEDDLDDLIASWETAETEINAADVADITGVSAESEDAELNVSAALLADRQKKALEDRPGEKGIRPAGLNVPKELFGDGVIKQTRKLREMRSTGYQQPMDFAELAGKRLSRELLEMPMATQSFYLDVGGSAQDRPFSSFSFQDGIAEITSGPKWDSLTKLAADFAGQKYDLGNPAHRKQMRMRLLRMFQPLAKPILKELAEAYFQRFSRPLRVTSLTRSMDYQILLNSNNPNSYKVRGEGSLPPHTSGCAFDLARKHMPADEQNFVMEKLADMERKGQLDALIEYGTNACLHVFIYHDGHEPRAFDLFPYQPDSFPFLASSR